MSYPSSPTRLRPNNHGRSKPVLRKVTLDIPEGQLEAIQANSRAASSCLCVQLMDSEQLTFYSPSVLIEFPPDTSASFVLDFSLPSAPQAVLTNPPPGLADARLLIYLSARNSAIFTSSVLFNGVPILHTVGDGFPIDVTDLLRPFGTENWVAAGSDSFRAPFFAVGVWGNRRSMAELLADLGSRRPFVSTVLDTCPISKIFPENPARGVNCHHDACFDATSFITLCEAIGCWQCPICLMPLPLDELMVDTSGGMSTQEVPHDVFDDGLGALDESPFRDGFLDF